MSLKGQVALVTGASRGIGSAIALELAKAGAEILVHFKSNQEAAEKVLAQVRDYSPTSELMALDLSRPEEIESGLAPWIEKKEPSILVCNAGISKESLIPRASLEHFEEVIRTNLLASTQLVRLLSRPMMRRRSGRIVLMSSVIGERGNKGQAAYAASKSALFGFGKSVAQELASRQITCNMICPGFIETEMTERLDDSLKQVYLNQIPLGRFGSAEDIARVVRFLCSDDASYITGATIDVNGGLLMR